MTKLKKWEIVAENREDTSTENIVTTLLANRGLKDKKSIEAFLHPDISSVTPLTVGIDEKQLKRVVKRIEQAIEKKEKIVVYGDYDVDGITGTAILWESLYALRGNVTPYIPHRVDEGYGLSIKGIDNLLSQEKKIDMIITVDNGIVANDAVQYAKEKGIDVIITDHHTIGEKIPDAFGIVHTTALCGAGVGWMLSRELLKKKDVQAKFATKKGYNHLALVALATVADLVPLTNANRIVLTFGLELLTKTTRPGLLALLKEAGVEPKAVDVYTIGHVIGPRLNAMGRLESAMDSLRLLCTTNVERAQELASKLQLTNKERQLLTQTTALHAKEEVMAKKGKKKLLFIHSEIYEEGVIGLVAGKLVEEFYVPSIVLSKGEKISKASARSVAGFNIIEFIRSASHLLVNAGGHPMAAGFTVETEKLPLLQETLETLAEKTIEDSLLVRVMKIDMKLPLEKVSQALYDNIQTLAPFGIGNPEPIFASEVHVKECRAIGMEGKHLKLAVTPIKVPYAFSAIAFGMGELSKKIKSGDTLAIAYTIDENVWNGKKELQLKIRDIQLHS